MRPDDDEQPRRHDLASPMLSPLGPNRALQQQGHHKQRRRVSKYLTDASTFAGMDAGADGDGDADGEVVGPAVTITIGTTFDSTAQALHEADGTGGTQALGHGEEQCRDEDSNPMGNGDTNDVHPTLPSFAVIEQLCRVIAGCAHLLRLRGAIGESEEEALGVMSRRGSPALLAAVDAYGTKQDLEVRDSEWHVRTYLSTVVEMNFMIVGWVHTVEHE